MNTINEINKLIIDTTKPVCLIRSASFLFEKREINSFGFLLSRSVPDIVVDIKKIPVIGTTNKSISNMGNNYVA